MNVSRRPLLKEAQWSSLVDMPADEEGLIRYCTLDRSDLEFVLAKRTAHTRLGLAIQLCYLRHVGRSLAHGETPPGPLVEFIAQQIGVHSDALAAYSRRETNRREQAAEVCRFLGLHAPGREDRRGALAAALASASATDKGMPIAQAIVAALRARKSTLLATDTLDRIGRAARVIARRQMEAALLGNLTPGELITLDGLLVVDPAIRQTRFAWLRAMPEAPSEKNLLSLIERLNFLRAIGLTRHHSAGIHPDRWMQLVREGAVTPSWLADDFNPGRRRAMVAAQLIELDGRLTDAVLTMFCRLIGRLFTKSRARQERRHLDDRKATARLLRMFGDTLRALTEANETGEDTFDVLDREVGWHRLLQARSEVEAMAATAQADPLLAAAERYSWIRRFAPALIETFVFRSARPHDPLVAAIELLRQLNRDERRALPPRFPIAHLTQKVRKIIADDDRYKRRLWEVASLAVLRTRLRAGDIWAEGSKAFCPLESQLMPGEAFASRKNDGDLNLGLPHDADAWIAEKQRELDFRLKKLNYQARAGKLAAVRLVNGILTIAKERTKIPKAKVEAAKWLILDRMPQVNITDLLAEVDTWTGFAELFTHLRTDDTIRSAPVLLAAVLGDATNLGAKRMADASVGITERQITWARLFHIRPETYKSALAAIINAQLAHPFARIWGNGRTSSSDGQFFRSAGRGAKRGEVNAHYSGDPGAKFYTWVSDQYGHFHILPMGATEDEAVYVLDGIYGHESRIDTSEHFVDTGGVNDLVFGLFALVGKRVAPRLRDLKDWRLHNFEGADSCPAIRHHIGERIDAEAIRAGWDEMLRAGVS
ncbi:Tn3 family transposase [Sphingobium ummariense]